MLPGLERNAEIEPDLVAQKHRKQASLDTESLVTKNITGKFATSSSTPRLHQLAKSGKPSARSSNDVLTGLAANQPLVAHSSNLLASTSFSQAYGYGLVDAAKAVAWAAGYHPYTLQSFDNLGGVHWGNDMVNAPESWAAGVTGQGITVAVIDSGVDITHPDLSENIWQNPGEVAWDGVDNDGNGYIDDVFGWNFGAWQNDYNILPGTADPGQSHGTHVAGTIAADNNGFGTIGVAPDAKIMSIRMGNIQTQADGTGQFVNAGDLAQAIYYAVNNGARVINMSLTWSDSAELQQALAYAASHNVITISAAGNSGLSEPGTPAKYANYWGISVGAVDSSGYLASFSNGAGYDYQLGHVVAPGVDVISTVPYELDNDGYSDGFAAQNGTSMAAPHVAGVVALMLSVNPYLTHDQVRSILTNSATTSGYFGSSLMSGHSLQTITPTANETFDWNFNSVPMLTSLEATFANTTPQTDTKIGNNNDLKPNHSVVKVSDAPASDQEINYDRILSVDVDPDIGWTAVRHREERSANWTEADELLGTSQLIKLRRRAVAA